MVEVEWYIRCEWWQNCGIHVPVLNILLTSQVIIRGEYIYHIRFVNSLILVFCVGKLGARLFREVRGEKLTGWKYVRFMWQCHESGNRNPQIVIYMLKAILDHVTLSMRNDKPIAIQSAFQLLLSWAFNFRGRGMTRRQHKLLNLLPSVKLLHLWGVHGRDKVWNAFSKLSFPAIFEL